MAETGPKMNATQLVDGILNDLSAVPDGQPIVMVNLLRYRAWADYPPGTETAQITGRQAYERYTQLTLPFLRKVGARPLWRADGRACPIAPKGEHWDEVILVRYPSRAAFGRMISDPEYQSGTIHRTAALEDSRLIACTSPQRIGRFAWWVLKLSSRLRGR
jgi:uncharacterized protein (DUF1330 family)